MAADRSEIIDDGEGLYMPVEQYLALDEATDGKYEYLNGYAYMLRPPSSYYASGGMVDLAGGSPAHALVAMNIGYILAGALRHGPCTVYSSDAKVKLAEKHYLYPNITVACDDQEDARYITNPTLMIEVLSPATEKRDRSAKFKAYKTLPSLQEYMLIGSQYKAIEVYRREDAFWKQSIYHEGDTVELASLDVHFPFEDVYHHVRFAG
jgi:Uma2 family endonuclease